jgi:glycosyltransferase involved in cell wall biosynthesis
MHSAGLVAIGSSDEAYVWTGGQYYLQHLIKCVSSLPRSEAVQLRDVWWMSKSKVDPFEEVRSLLGESLVVSPPATLWGRLARRLSRAPSRGASDLFRRGGIDVFFPAPPCANSGTPYVFWIPDFQHLRRPDLMTEQVRDGFARGIEANVHDASQIVLSSFDARRDFAGRYPQLVDRTHVVRFCSVPDDAWWSLDPLEVAQKYGLPERFLIVCNQFTRHKNHLALMEAVRLLVAGGRGGIHLVCTGSTFDYRGEDYVGQVNAFLRQHGLESKVTILGLIPRAEQIALLRRAAAVVQPSLFEGWSTVIEDAKTLGKPVFASDLPVHREQLGEAHPWYLDPDNPAEWARALHSCWDGLVPGPDVPGEQAGSVLMQNAQRECGLAFVAAMKAAISHDAA